MATERSLPRPACGERAGVRGELSRADVERPTDRQRDSRLRALGYRVIRVWNNDVIENADGVLQMLLSELEKQPLTPSLSPQAGRGR